MTRKEANLEICKRLTEYFENNPELRFTQGLFSLKINSFRREFNDETGSLLKLEDKYNEESIVTLKKLENEIK
jgi:hypothetical protein